MNTTHSILSPGFWNTLESNAAKGRVCIIDRVRKELERQGDQLRDWVNTRFRIAFRSTDDEDVIEAYGRIIEWVYRQSQFRDYAKTEFSKAADGWLVAYALAKKCIVVTHEAFAPDIRKRVKIPNVCEAFGVSYTNTFEMLRTFRVRWDNLLNEDTELLG